MGARQDHSPITEEQRETFLDELADGASIVDAAEKSGRNRRSFYRLKLADRDFADQWAVAYEEGTDRLEAEAERRAVDGVNDVKMVGYGENAELVTVKKYSDTLLIFLLKARRPAKFRDHFKVEHSGDPDKPVVLEHRGVKLSDILDVARTAGLEPGDR